MSAPAATAGRMVNTADLITREQCAREVFQYPKFKAYEQMLLRFPHLKPRTNPATGETSWQPPQPPEPINPGNFNKLWVRGEVEQWRDELTEWKSWPFAKNVIWDVGNMRWRPASGRRGRG